VHLGGTADEVRAGENVVAAGRIAEHPYVLVVQPSVMDTSRAPSGHGVLWAYLHVPPGSTFDPTEAVLAQLERVAPGVRDLVVASTAMTARERESYNPSEIGGDILGGAFSFTQAVRRPVWSRHPWRTPMRGVYLASASTPPGPGVTGMPGWHAARAVLADAGQRVSLDDLFS
jgi:phytoene dehydrogenase-like protein